MEYWWTSKSSNGDCRGQNAMDWGIPYIIGKILEHRCLKCTRMTHLDIWNTSYGQMKGRDSNWHFDSRPLKVGNQPDFVVCRWLVTYRSKALDEDYNFYFKSHFNRTFARKVIGPQSCGNPNFGISRLPFGSLGTKCHLDVGLVESHRVYYKGEGGGFL
jgi:hypothetical protein